MGASNDGGDVVAVEESFAHRRWNVSTCRDCRSSRRREENVAATALRLTFAIADYPHTAALKSGAIRFEGIEPQFADVKPQIAAYRRMVRQVEFDVCELAPTTYIIARAYNLSLIHI